MIQICHQKKCSNGSGISRSPGLVHVFFLNIEATSWPSLRAIRSSTTMIQSFETTHYFLRSVQDIIIEN